MYIVSKCLLGVCCKYSGGHSDSPQVREFLKGKPYIAVCPETAGGLPIPRPPAEIQADKVVDKEGRDVTEAFVKGAEAAWRQSVKAAAEAGCEIQLAILKARSPSCGEGIIYDGTFTGTTVPGDGHLAALLKSKGISVCSEENLPDSSRL